MALKPPIDSIQNAVIDVFSVNDGKLSVEQQIEVYGKKKC
jgi:Ca2+-transporting ATPase